MSKNLVPNDATVAERQHKCSRFWPTKSARSTTVPPPLRHLREFEDLAAERSDVTAAEAAYLRRRDELQARNEQTLRAHREAVHAAIDAGEQPPAAPTLEESPDLPVSTTLLDADDGSPGRLWTHNPTLERFEQKHCSIEAAELSLMAERADEWKQAIPTPEARKRVDDAERELTAARNALAPLEAACTAIDAVAGPLRLAREKHEHDRVQAEQRDEWDGAWRPIRGRVESAKADARMAEVAAPPKPARR